VLGDFLAGMERLTTASDGEFAATKFKLKKLA